MYTITTAIGPVGISWNERGITGVKLGCTRGNVNKQPPTWVRTAIQRIIKHLEGTNDSLNDIKVDLSSCPEFHQKVYRALRKVKPGTATTYGKLAKKVGKPGAARAVGTAMAKNPVPLIVPCHRVIKADGSLGNFSAPGGARAKRRILEIESSY